jgi:predicted DNA-binding transcriptional regulator YafY
VQADLNIIRVDMRLPLIRRQGYRFADETGAYVGRGALDFGDVLALVGLFAAARTAAFEVGDDLSAKLVRLVPLHLQPLARELFLGDHREHLRQIATAALAPADQNSVRVRLLGWDEGTHDMVTPELIVPYRGHWYIVGHDSLRRRARMWRLDRVASVEPVAVRIERKTRGAA